MKPINPTFPFFTAPCAKCDGSVNSLTGACGDDPFTFVCFAHQDDKTREAVRLHVSEQVRRFAREQPAQVAHARRSLGIRRPAKVQPSPDWEGCGVE